MGARWIHSARVDALLVIGAPILCVALVLPLTQVLAPASLWVGVMAFGAVGHHLPGFVRTYGNRELFARYRWRFLIAPPLVFAVTLWCASRSLHAVALVALVWSVWHGMMQHYGFMRIYDAKAGTPRAIGARLDLGITVAWFSTCLLFGPHLSASIVDGLLNAGVPLPTGAALSALRVIAAIATALMTAVYVADVVLARRRGESVSMQKLVLLIATVALVWFARVATTDPYTSVVLFEVVHDVQYLAIVWAFNRRLVDSGRDRGVPSRAMFGMSIRSLAMYIAACAAYGALAFVTYTRLPEGSGKSMIVSLLVTSGLLHYYYDGFIWKLRHAGTRDGLALAGGAPPAAGRDRRALVHLAAFAVVVIALVSFEARRDNADPLRDARRIAELVPDSPTARHNLGIELFDLGTEKMGSRDPLAAIEAYEHALELGVRTTMVHANLGYALTAIGKFDEAEQHLAAARKLDPASFAAQLNTGLLLSRQGRFDEALPFIQTAVKLRPDMAEARNDLGAVLLKLGRTDEAIVQLREALRIDPTFAPARYNLQRLTGSP